MSIQDLLVWPDMFKNNVTDFSDIGPRVVLAMQLVSWGNIMMGCEPPKNFFDVMDAASKISGAFTPDQCMARSDELMGDDFDED